MAGGAATPGPLYVTVVGRDASMLAFAGQPMTDQESPAAMNGVPVPRLTPAPALAKEPVYIVPVVHAPLPQAGVPPLIAHANEYAVPAPFCLMAAVEGPTHMAGMAYDVGGALAAFSPGGAGYGWGGPRG